MESNKIEAFAYHILKGAEPLDVFDLIYPAQKDLKLSQKYKAIDKIFNKMEQRNLIKPRRKLDKKQAYTLEDVESGFVSIAEASVFDFLSVGVDSAGRQVVQFQPLAAADLRNVKSIKIGRLGEISITMYDRMEALKALAIMINAREQGTDNFAVIRDSLGKLYDNLQERNERNENEENYITSDENNIT